MVTMGAVVAAAQATAEAEVAVTMSGIDTEVVAGTGKDIEFLCIAFASTFSSMARIFVSQGTVSSRT